MDRISKEQCGILMSKIRSRDTGPERILRTFLHVNGYRFRKHYGRHKIDIALPKRQIAIFVDG